MRDAYDRQWQFPADALIGDDDLLPADTSEMRPPVDIPTDHAPPRDADIRDRLFAALPHGIISNAARSFYRGPRALNDKQLRAAFAVADASTKPGATYACKVYEACLGELRDSRMRRQDGEPPESDGGDAEFEATLAHWPPSMRAELRHRRQHRREETP